MTTPKKTARAAPAPARHEGTVSVTAPEQSGPAKLSARAQAEQVLAGALAMALQATPIRTIEQQTIASQALANAEAAQRLLALLP